MQLLKNILSQRCPKCRKGHLFKSAAYNLKHFAEMPEKCQCCGQSYHLEPSFFYGALYVSYALQVALFTTVAVAITVLFPEASTSTYIISVAAAGLIIFPLIFRISRTIWIHFFVRYDKDRVLIHQCKE